MTQKFHKTNNDTKMTAQKNDVIKIPAQKMKSHK